MFGSLIKKIFGSKSARDVKRLRPLVAKVNRLDEEYKSLTDEQLRAKTEEFKRRIADGESLDSILCEAFAAVKNACRRMCGNTYEVCGHNLTWDMVPFDVQIIGGIVLHQGKIAEMATGEGKTLVATFPLYLNALTGKNCQLVTVNDYLARRDSEWMGNVFRFLGLTVGCIQNEMDPEERREQYACDITYGTNSEFGFDYLRDMGMAPDKDYLVQRDYYFAIVDEVDSILIDEARTPLIISGPVSVSTHQFDALKPVVADLFKRQSLLCSRLVQEAKNVLDRKDELPEDEVNDAVMKLLQVKMGMPKHKQLMHMLQEAELLKRLEKLEGFVRSDQNRGMLQEVQAELFFAMDERRNEADLTEKGRGIISGDDPEAFVLPDLVNSLQDIEQNEALSYEEKLQEKQKFQENYASKSERLQNISQLLRAYCLFEKDVHYVVAEGKVLIVDEHTGRILPGRRFSDGLHQALEAKEDVKIEKETQTLATITIQNYFRMYDKLAGMTGTAETEANEFHQIYKLDVVVIPTNKPCRRVDGNDCVYKTKREKFNAIVDEAEEAWRRGQPVLLGTISVDDSEVVSRMLKRRGIPHNVLNAKNHERESEIVSRAGQRCAVTVATNMAGRGTDIKLGPGVEELGGLLVLGSSRHDSRRIDRQLRGRSARQGDPGASHFYVSLEDSLMRLFGSDRIVRIMERFGMEEGEDLQHPWLNKSIETAQRRVEQHHFSIRKRTLEYDDVMNKQREVIYGFRRETLFNEDCRQAIFDIIEIELARHIEEAVHTVSSNQKGKSDILNKDLLLGWLNTTFPIGFREEEVLIAKPNGAADEEAILTSLLEKIKKSYAVKEELEDPEALKWLERRIILDAIDHLWQDHLRAMDELRDSIGLRAYAQKDPLVEYKREAFAMFDRLMTDIDQEILSHVFRSATNLASFEHFAGVNMSQQILNTESFDSIPSIEGGNMPELNPEEPQAQMPEISISFKRETPKVGPNEPCPCGSGKKFKKCCGK
ncbi:MAG: preprotein translocase subunit SecA [Lentisphaeria bacterium]|nr:preprotein translocase subunit SecA [Lentisphaeria bacterium]